MVVEIYGPNLPKSFQDLGQFHVHARGCADCKKLDRVIARSGGGHYSEEHATAESVALSIYADMISDGSMTVDEAMGDIHFYPCVNFAFQRPR